jgi:hypothetical protein
MSVIGMLRQLTTIQLTKVWPEIGPNGLGWLAAKLCESAKMELGSSSHQRTAKRVYIPHF